MSAGTVALAPLRLAGFGLWFALEVVRSSAAVLADILTPGSRATPRVVRLPLADAGDGHVTTIAALITLTPGTLALGAAPRADGGRDLLVHSMYHDTEAAALDDLRDMDHRLLRAATGRRDAR